MKQNSLLKKAHSTFENFKNFIPLEAYFYLIYTVRWYVGGIHLEEFGELLYAGKTDNNKNGIVFIILGMIMCIGANFIYAKMIVMIMGGIIALMGLYLLIFKRSEKFFIYEKAIVIHANRQEYVITKEQISRIEYEEIKVRRSPVKSYYPVLVLDDENKILINKAFNPVINQGFRKIIESYM